ncbi:MAG TPA: ABC transporter permease [Panacibacter sp.]|nr:ABC transporter permease [Panacibacter sp.]
MFKNYFKTAWRSLWKNKATAAINIFGLSVGMTAAVFIFLWVQNELSFDEYHKDANNIYRLTNNLQAHGWIWETTPLLFADAIQKDAPEVEKIARVYDGNTPVFNINNNASYEKKCAYVDAGWFDIFHYDFINGSVDAFAEDPNSIILTASDAVKYFGKTAITGTVIHVDSTDLVVRAVVKDAPANSSFQYTSFIPLSNLLKDKNRRENDEDWENANYVTFIKARPSANVASLQKTLTGIYARNANDNETAITLMPLKQMHFETEIENSVYRHGNKNTVYIFTVLAILLLVIACINYVNLTTAKASLRAKEVSVRKIVGANRLQLFYQFMAEALLVSFISMLITLLLVLFCLPVFNAVTDKSFTVNLASASMWVIIGITLLAAFVLNSIYPALTLSSFKPLNVFRGLTVLKIKDSYFRKSLVVFQFTISVMLICGTIVIYRQMQFVQDTNPGYNKSQVLNFYLPRTVDYNTKDITIQTIKNELLSKRNIESVTIANQGIADVGSYSSGAADWEGRDTSFNPKIAQLSADADFAKTMQLQMKEGRWFQQGNAGDKNNVVLNETAINELQIHRPYIGQRFRWKGNTGEIIGVVKDFKYRSLHDKTGPLVAFQAPNWYNLFSVRMAPTSASQSIADVENIWKKFFPGTPLEYNFLDDSFNNLYKADQQTASLIFGFAIIAIVISALGLFALAAFTAEQKAKEIGIRKVLGASVTSITQLLTKDFLKLVIVAIILALPVAWIAMDKWLQNFAYRINIAWWMFLLAGIVAVVIAISTISFQAIKAAIANPVKSLRTE